MSHEHPLKRLGHAGEPDRRSEPMADRAEPHADRAAMLGALISVSGSQGVVHFGPAALADDEAYVTVGS
jgi:hypothetical protein